MASRMEAREAYEKQKREAEAEAEAERQRFIEKSKAFRKQMQKNKARRIAVRNEGYTDLPKPYSTEVVEYEDEPGETYMVFTKPEGKQ